MSFFVFYPIDYEINNRFNFSGLKSWFLEQIIEIKNDPYSVEDKGKVKMYKLRENVYDYIDQYNIKRKIKGRIKHEYFWILRKEFF